MQFSPLEHEVRSGIANTSIEFAFVEVTVLVLVSVLVKQGGRIWLTYPTMRHDIVIIFPGKNSFSNNESYVIRLLSKRPKYPGHDIE